MAASLALLFPRPVMLPVKALMQSPRKMVRRTLKKLLQYVDSRKMANTSASLWMSTTGNLLLSFISTHVMRPFCLNIFSFVFVFTSFCIIITYSPFFLQTGCNRKRGRTIFSTMSFDLRFDRKRLSYFIHFVARMMCGTSHSWVSWCGPGWHSFFHEHWLKIS